MPNSFTIFRGTLVNVDTQNITLALPKRTLQKVKVIAAQRHTSVSALLTQALEEIAMKQTRYAAARSRQIEAMRTADKLGTYGQAAWTRDELHER